jgi:hypothetical protein
MLVWIANWYHGENYMQYFKNELMRVQITRSEHTGANPIHDFLEIIPPLKIKVSQVDVAIKKIELSKWSNNQSSISELVNHFICPLLRVTGKIE